MYFTDFLIGRNNLSVMGSFLDPPMLSEYTLFTSFQEHPFIFVNDVDVDGNPIPHNCK